MPLRLLKWLKQVLCSRLHNDTNSGRSYGIFIDSKREAGIANANQFTTVGNRCERIMVLAPGSITQHMYLRERLQLLPPGKFIEVGAGRGNVSRILLEHGWSGVSYDLNPNALEQAKKLNDAAVKEGRFSVICGDWLTSQSTGKVDMIISCFVLEHLDDQAEDAYFAKSRDELAEGGQIVLMVPANPDRWTIEDDIAGHYRRYTRERLNQLAEKHSFHCRHVAGLNFPLTNILQPIGNLLIKAHQIDRSSKDISLLERTKLSGNRQVPFLTAFPPVLSIILNPVTLAPFHWLQKANKDNTQSLVLYFEATHKEGGVGS